MTQNFADILPILLYAETHFRFFRFFPSLLYKNQPEVLFDAPRRLSPGQDLPIFFIINDIVQQVKIKSIRIALSAPPKKTEIFTFVDYENCEINNPFSIKAKSYIFTIPRNKLPNGEVFITATATLLIKNKLVTILTDNFFGTSKSSLKCYIASDELPYSNNCSYGDIHAHSHYSQSHVEFGPPLSVISKFSKAYGTTFTAVTDHSYDLRCSMDNYLKHDDKIPRWSEYLHELKTSNSIINNLLCGEEISCLNSKKKTIHLLSLGTEHFLYGDRDGARFNKNKNNELHVSEAIEAIHSHGGIAVAAHPGSKARIMQKLFLNRGDWTSEELSYDIDAFQIANSSFNAAFKKSKALWLNELKHGNRLPIVGGNDAHGDFNRYRAIEIPFTRIFESEEHYFSYVLTGIYGILSPDQICDRIKAGCTFVTNGPFLSICQSEILSDSLISSTVILNLPQNIYITARSNSEFGHIVKVLLICYLYGKNENSEKVLSKTFPKPGTFDVLDKVETNIISGSGYLRAELLCKNKAGRFFEAYTSPCYFSV